MKHFWALPVALRLALAAKHQFNVLDDLLAYPQYEVAFSASFVTEGFAQSRLAYEAAKSTPSITPEAKETVDLAHIDRRNGQTNDHEDEAEVSYERMVLGDQQFLCSIPLVKPQEVNETADAQSAEEEQKELARATDRGWELLGGMKGNCVYFLSGWWSYSLCYNMEVKQFHQLPPSRGVPIYPPTEDPGVPSFVLGRFPSKKNKKKMVEADDNEDVENKYEVAKLETKGDSRYMIQRLAGGTQCDLTGKDRKIEIQYHCHQGTADRIAMIKEVATCSYLMVIHTPRLCNDVAFQPPQENRPNTIACQEIIAEEAIPAWTEQHLKSGKSSDVIINTEEGPTEARPIIGGIEVGGKKEVGSPGKVIEKSAVAGGGKEKFIGTVASTTGKSMTKEELKKHNTDPKDVERLSKDLGKLAGGKDWRLDLVETARGKEFRGIIEAEADESNGDEGDPDEDEQMLKDLEEKYGRADDPADQDEEGMEGSEEVYYEEL